MSLTEDRRIAELLKFCRKIAYICQLLSWLRSADSWLEHLRSQTRPRLAGGAKRLLNSAPLIARGLRLVWTYEDAKTQEYERIREIVTAAESESNQFSAHLGGRGRQMNFWSTNTLSN
jgi:hypothetical protein